jgi:hypothetical protein
VIPVSDETVELFGELRKLRDSPPPAVDPETGKLAHFLIVRPNGRRFSRDAFRYHLGKIEREIQLKEHPTPHRLRHGYATRMLRAGMSLTGLMKLLGHRTIVMTLRYALVANRDVEQAYARALEALEGRYEIPIPPALLNRGQSTTSSDGQAILSQISALAMTLDTFRRDHAKPSQKKRIQRFVERLRRLANDFRGLTS